MHTSAIARYMPLIHTACSLPVVTAVLEEVVVVAAVLATAATAATVTTVAMGRLTQAETAVTPPTFVAAVLVELLSILVAVRTPVA